MFRWVPYPFLRFTPALIAGILIGLHCAVDLSITWAVGLFLVYGVVALGVPAQRRHRFATVTGVVGLVAMVVAGMIRVNQYNAARNPSHLLHYTPRYSHYIATVTAPAESRTNSWRTTAQLECVFVRDSSNVLQESPPLLANILLYQPKADSLRLLRYGDRILVKGIPQVIDAPANPGAFDQHQYWATQQIFHQQYLRADQWELLGHHSAGGIARFTYHLRERSKELLTTAIKDGEARGIALALVLGVKDQLDERVREAYGRAGAMHVLAVSGLHIGIVYGVIAFLLMPLRRIRWGRSLHALLCILVLWLFALVAGGSVSVMRAATMFTCVIVADATQRRANIFNTLALSAFLLLLINPYYLLSVGFQLSYLAVLGIVYLQPRIYRLFTSRYWLVDKLWALTAVSVAAQIATLPISLYYFHQFPTYFWLANIVVIPAAFIILSVGLLTVGGGAIATPLLTFFGSVLEQVIVGVNALVYAIEQLPMSYIDRLYVDLPQVIILYSGIATIALLFYYRKFRYLLIGCCCLVSVAVLKFHHHWEQSRRQQITFYQVKGQSNVDFTDGTTNFHWGNWTDQAAYQIANHHLQAGLTTHFLDSTTAQYAVPRMERNGITLAVWQGKKLAFVHDTPIVAGEIALKIRVDYVVVSNNAIRTLGGLDKLFLYGVLIIDSSNSRYQSQKLAAEAKAANVPCHAVLTQGAFQITL